MKILKIPFPNSSILAGTTYDYTDSYCGNLNKSHYRITQQDIGKAFFLSAPKWVGTLMVLRNKIVSVFGLKTGNNLKPEDILDTDFDLQKGTSIGIFKVFDKNDNEIVMGEDDSHLNFRVSLLLEPEEMKKTLTISTAVIFNNWLGRLYFLPVKPFHKVIVKSMLKRTLQGLEN
ncbi:DUF2867 domain-containing protein [Aquimarina sp. AU474]|uniref:DUF2867 domain-containing protein n=1 Tax=Aquimarina sp. AU474 TaxID=2108529 RepID=UPI000D69C3E5|nr:DUF2867 domain-containing protein [Aquimarina sp. AU474]